MVYLLTYSDLWFFSEILCSFSWRCLTLCSPTSFPSTPFDAVIHLTLLFFLSPCVCACTPSHWVLSELSDPLDCSPPASSVSGISQVRTLEWVAMPFSRGFPALTGGFFTTESPAETLPPHTPHSFFPSSIQQIYLSCEVQPVHGVQEPKLAPK